MRRVSFAVRSLRRTPALTVTVVLVLAFAIGSATALRLTVPPERWIADALGVPGVRTAALSTDIAVDAGLIPALPDSIDRLLVSTARHLDATLLSADRRILQYAADTHQVRVQDASR